MPSAPEIVCTRCMRWHPEPACDHNAEAPCARCGFPRGYRWTGDDKQAAEPADLCWFCVFDRPRVAEEKRAGVPEELFEV